MSKKDAADKADKEIKKPLTGLRAVATEEDNPDSDHAKITLSSILGGDMLGGQWFRRNLAYIFMVVAMCIVYISNRYSCQQDMIENKNLNDSLLDARYKALTRSSELKEKTRRSNIEQSLADTALQTSKTPSFNLQVEGEEE